MAIDPIGSAALTLVQGGQTSPASAAGSSDATGSGLSFGDLIGNVEKADTDANTAVGNMLEAMIALQRPDVMLQLTVQIRNKLVSAYQDVMRMPI
jgi:flagellar hook-basal body complex protein FliE